jgi:pimeloyl-ACP methyl ester carboxylesterase
LFSLAHCRTLAAALVFLFACLPALASPNGAASAHVEKAPSSIVIGFVGGFVRHDNPHHGPVQITRRLRESVPPDTFLQVFENRHRRTAYHTILRLLDTNHDGSLSGDEKGRARIILFGHSWGGSATVMLARELRREGIPVLLTVQVDSVAKPWQNDSVIPPNVAEAINYYQPHGIIHGRALITAADPGKTQILGNYRMDYRKDPISCPELSWYDRVLTPGHAQSECDPRLWTAVEELVRQHLAPAPVTAVATSRPASQP